MVLILIIWVSGTVIVFHRVPLIWAWFSNFNHSGADRPCGFILTFYFTPLNFSSFQCHHYIASYLFTICPFYMVKVSSLTLNIQLDRLRLENFEILILLSCLFQELIILHWQNIWIMNKLHYFWINNISIILTHILFSILSFFNDVFLALPILNHDIALVRNDSVV